MKLYFMLVRRVPPVSSPVLSEAFDILTQRGFQVETGIAEEMLLRSDDLSVEHDLYLLKSHTELSLSLAGVLHLLKSHTELSLSLAGVLHDQGARFLNPYPSSVAAQDKIIASRRLREAGIPAPNSWVTGDLTLLRSEVEAHPLIIKPYRGHRGAGIHIVHNPDELATVPAPESPMLVHEYIRGSGEDLKVYVVGEEVFAVRKPFSTISFTQPGQPCSVSAEVREIALRCGQTFGLGLYGLDVIEGPNGPTVVDLNFFPGYKGVPNAAYFIANYIEDYARGRCSLDLPLLPAIPQRELERLLA